MYRKLFFIPFFIFIAVVSINTTNYYPGTSYIYYIFTVSSNLLLYCAFRKDAIFFDKFIAILLWLGFWFKATIHILYKESNFGEGLQSITVTGNIFDEALIISPRTVIVPTYAPSVSERTCVSAPV